MIYSFSYISWVIFYTCMQGVPKWFWASFTPFCLLFFCRFRVLQGETLSKFGQKIVQGTPKGHHFKTHCLKVVKSSFSFSFSLSKGAEFSVIVTSPRESLGLDSLFDFQSYIWGIYFGHPLHIKEVGPAHPCIAKWRGARACYFPLFTFNCLPYLFFRKRVVWLG